MKMNETDRVNTGVASPPTVGGVPTGVVILGGLIIFFTLLKLKGAALTFNELDLASVLDPGG